MTSEVMIPPWVLPESPETIRWIDDATSVFAPAFGRGFTQRGSFGDPRWGLRRRYRGMRSDQLAAIRVCLNESRGQFNRILVTPHTPLRGGFPAAEVFLNPAFENGTTGWVGDATYNTIAVADRIVRSTRIRTSTSALPFLLAPSAAVSVTQYAPYVARYMVLRGNGDFTTSGMGLFDSVASDNLAVFTDYGLLSKAFVPRFSTALVGIYDNVASGAMAGDYVILPFASLSRCGLVDARPNMIVRSDEFDNASWTKTRSSVSANATTAPNGTLTADRLIEDATASNSHFAIQTGISVASSAADYAFTVALRAGTRTRAIIGIVEGASNHEARAWIDLSNGSLGTVTTTGANWTNVRAPTPVALGDSWYRHTLVGRKVSAATTLQVYVALATADASLTYSGDGASYISVWRATLAPSSVATSLSSTGSSATTGATLSGGSMTVKGLPASTNNLLQIGDWLEVASQLKQCTAPLNSDSAGLGVLQFRPALGDSPADNDPVIINQPFGRFMYSGQQKELENLFGLYGDVEMNLEEVYA